MVMMPPPPKKILAMALTPPISGCSWLYKLSSFITSKDYRGLKWTSISDKYSETTTSIKWHLNMIPHKNSPSCCEHMGIIMHAKIKCGSLVNQAQLFISFLLSLSRVFSS